MRILVVAAVLGLTASCAWPPQEAAAPSAVAAPALPVTMSPPPPSPLVVAEPTAPEAVAVATPRPPASEVEYVAVPLLWWRMLTQPLPAGRLMLNNFSFGPTRIQAALVSGPVCAVADPSAATEFVLPSNGTRVVPAPPGFDICWRRELTAGERSERPAAAPWTEWSRAYTGPGRFLDAVVVLPPQPPVVAATIAKALDPPPPVSPAQPKFPRVEK